MAYVHVDKKLLYLVLKVINYSSFFPHFHQVFGRKAEFVMTQHPLKSTTEDFWRMMIERNFSTIVVIGNVKEEVCLMRAIGRGREM